MGRIRPHPPVLLIVGALSRYEQAFAWTRRRVEAQWGPIALASEVLPFDATRYYEKDMGPGLKKVFYAMEALIDPGRLAPIKVQTNAWEELYAQQAGAPTPRPLNLDPGYLTEAKLVLASTKDRDHRIYLDQGVFAEVTLYYQRGAWREQPWTYPDYRRPEYHAFFTRCRQRLRQTLGRRTP